MIRPFHLRDIRLVARLRQTGTPLDIEEQLIHPRSPVRSALINSLFSPRATPSTFILDQHDENRNIFGMAQMRVRPGRPERDVVFLSPTLDTGTGSHALWQRLLTHLSVQAADNGYLRLYASLPVDGEELQIFKNVGFFEYCREDIYHFASEIEIEIVDHIIKLRPQQPGDEWGLQKLYAILTPHPVQNVEGLAQGQWSLGGRHWGEQGRHYGYVWELNGELLGALHLHAGRQGCWIRALLHPDAIDQLKALSKAAFNLASIKINRHLPVYFAVRDYQSGWRIALTDLGFKPLVSQSLVVKSMAARISNKTSILRPVLEKTTTEVAVTTIRTDSLS